MVMFETLHKKSLVINKTRWWNQVPHCFLSVTGRGTLKVLGDKIMPIGMEFGQSTKTHMCQLGYANRERAIS